MILRDWDKDYDRLEAHHGFIQWYYQLNYLLLLLLLLFLFLLNELSKLAEDECYMMAFTCV